MSKIEFVRLEPAFMGVKADGSKYLVGNNYSELQEVIAPGLSTDTSGNTVLMGPDGTINLRHPQTAVIFGDSGWHYGWITGRPFLCINEAGTFAGAMLVSALAASAENLCFVGSATPIALNGLHTISTKQTGATAVNITNVSAHTDGRVKITAVSHGLTAGQVAIVASLTSAQGGVEFEVNNLGHFVHEVIDANNYTLDGLTFSGTYVSGGTSQKGHGLIFPYTGGSYAKIGKLVSNLDPVVTFTQNRVTGRSAFHEMQQRLGQPFEVVNYAAVNSQDSGPMFERLQRDVFDFNPGWCFVHATANDVRVLSKTAEVAAENCKLLMREMLNHNIRVVYLEWLPDNSSDTNNYAAGATNALSLTHSTIMKKWCKENGVIFVSQWESLSDPSSATGDGYAQRLWTDGIHLSAPGAQLVGQALAAAVGPYVTAVEPLLPCTQLDNHSTNAASDQYFRNPLLVTDTNSDGTADGVTIAVSPSGGTVVATLVARTVATDGDILGNNQKIVWTPGSATQELYIKFLCTAADVVAGDMIEGAMMLSFDADAAGNYVSVAGVYTIINNFAHYSAVGIPDGSGSNAYKLANAANQIMVTPTLKVPAGTTVTEAGVWTILKPATGWTSGAITINCGRIAVRKVAELSVV